MAETTNEFVNQGGKLIGSKIPNTSAYTTAKNTTDKTVRMSRQPFMYTIYRRFFSEEELPHTAKADEYANNPKLFYEYLENLGEAEQFEKYFQPSNDPKDKLREASRMKAYEIMLKNRKDVSDVLPDIRNEVTIDEIREKEELLLGKLDKITEYINREMNPSEKKVILSYFKQKIRNG
jgi:hypothetical protein